MNRKFKLLITLSVVVAVLCCATFFVACNRHTKHNYGAWTVTKEPTCTEKGLRVRTCIDCGEQQTEDLPLTDHVIADSTVTKEPDCVTAGEETGVCTKCGQSVTVAVDALGHDPLGIWINDANCHWHRCSRCDVHLDEETHNMTDNGCSVCGYGKAIVAQLTFELLSDDTYAVTGYSNSDATAVEIPATYNGKAVSTIANKAFYMKFKISSVTIAEGITTLGDSAFYYAPVTKLTIPDSVTNWGNNVFAKCTKLETVVLGKGLTALPNNMFKGCTNLQSVTIPDTVQSIGQYAFAETALTELTLRSPTITFDKYAFQKAQSLEKIVFAEGVETIGAKLSNYAFEDCVNLKEVQLSSTVTSVSSYFWSSMDSLSAIKVAEDNAEFRAVDGILYDKGNSSIVLVPKCVKGVVNVAEGTTTISERAFAYCQEITQINLPDTVTSVGQYAFLATNITSMSFPDSVKTIGDNVFSKCTNLNLVHIGKDVTNINNMFGGLEISLDTLTVSADNATYKSVNNGLLSKDGTKLYYANKLGEIPQGVITFGDYAFENHSEITNITIPEGVKILPRGLFCNCAKLENVTLPQSLVRIGEYAFQGCAIKEITIPASCIEVGVWAFDTCTDLNKVTFVDTTGWKAYPNGSGTAIDLDVTNAETNAVNFLGDYYQYRWAKG